MTTIRLSASALGRRIMIALVMAGTSQLFGQTAPSAPTAADLAKYDANKNGKLDPEELAQKNADDAKNNDITTLTPFEVSTEKDVGYAAGNTLSGGRVDTPLAITPGSISVMT